MTPIQKISRRNQALSILGIQGNPTRAELRRAFRKLAFKMHPDHGEGTSEAFARLSDAYNLLAETALDDEPGPANAITHRPRPTVPAMETVFDAAIQELCKQALNTAENIGTPHIATRLFRKGRMLTYLVPTRPSEGLNQVALPTGDLVDPRKVETTLLEVWSGDLCGSGYDVPAQVCARLFPGARSVQVRFAETAEH